MMANTVRLQIKRLSKLLKEPPRSLWVASVVLAIFVTLSLIKFYAVNVPYSDDWSIVSLFQHYQSHTLTFSTFFEQHNEHRIFFPRLVILLLAITSHWNQLTEIWLSFILAIITYWILAGSMISTFGRQSNYLYIVLAVTPWIFFSPIQWENWLWGWQIEWTMTLLAVVLSIRLLITKRIIYKNYWSNLVVALALTIVGSYSVSNGLLLWPIGLAILLLKRHKLKYVITWATTGLIICSTYFIDYKSPSSGNLALLLHRPFDFLNYIFVLMGRPLGSDISSSSQYGIFLLLIFFLASGYIVFKKSDLVKEAINWFALGAFCIFSFIFISIGRFNFGVNQAMSSRYTIISSLFIVVVIVIGILAFLARPSSIEKNAYTGEFVGFAILACFVLSLVFNNYFYGVTSMQNQKSTQLQVMSCMQHVQSASDSCLRLSDQNSNPKTIWKDIQALRGLNW